ncbi:MAG: oligosaccharide flippase family protein [Candidatus Choladocola sp.]|nr:oligosaccharide flippase family protein [Candidatus Choladocola sp.]
MNQRHYLLKGTFLLTLTGILTKTAGFFYKIFLSRTIGADQIGLYQLALPVYMLCLATAAGGTQTTISRFTAEFCAKNDRKAALRILLSGLILSLVLSLGCMTLLLCFSGFIADRFLMEPQCEILLQILAVSLPFCVVHGCISGYFIGRKNVSVSAVSQLMEQLIRIASFFFFYALFTRSGRPLRSSVMALGQFAGEIASSVCCILALMFEKSENVTFAELLPRTADFRKTVHFSLPLGLNRTLLCVLQGIEAALLPRQLQLSGPGSAQALTIYGTLTGMALPLIFFPTAFTGTLGSLLLPAVSEARALNQNRKIRSTVAAVFQGSLLLGFFFLAAFLLFGRETGLLLFHSDLAGQLICRLSLLCPFLYINTSLTGILHGFDKTTALLLWNVAGFLIRLSSIHLLVPSIGVNGYLTGILLSQIFLTVCSLITLYRVTHFSADLTDALIKPGMVCILCSIPVFLLRLRLFPAVTWISLILQGGFYMICFLLVLVCLFPEYRKFRTVCNRLKKG